MAFEGPTNPPVKCCVPKGLHGRGARSGVRFWDAVYACGRAILIAMSHFVAVAVLLAVPLAAQVPSARRAAPKPAHPAPAAPPAGASPVAQRWLRSLTLEQKIAQLVIVPIYGEDPSSRSRAYREYAALVRDYGVGGLILVNRVTNGTVRHAEPHAVATFLNRMQRLARIPLIVGGDFERGASMRVEGTTKFPHNMAYAAARDTDGSGLEGAATAREARALGVHWIFAPVADVNNNPGNPIINIRAYSEDPRETAEHVKAYIRGAHTNATHPVLVTVKHFPGHGDTSTDSHMDLAKIEADRDRLNKVELPPFRAAIEAGVDAIMTAHLWVPALEPRQIPATVSAPVLTGLLRKEMGFRGLIVTDAMDMQGLRGLFTPAEASIRALDAGADILLMPAQPLSVIRGVAAAVRQGRLSAARVDQSVLRVLNAKVKLGLHLQKLVNVESLSDGIESEDADAAALRVAQKAITLVKNDPATVPLANPDGSCWLVLSESRYSAQGRAMMDALARRIPKAQRRLLDPQVPASEIEAAASNAATCESVNVAAFAGPAAFRGGLGLDDRYAGLMTSVLAAGKPVTLVSLGNPYLLSSYPKVAAYLATFSTAPVAEEAVVKAILGDAPIQGKLPVSIPPLAKIGEGIALPARNGNGR